MRVLITGGTGLLGRHLIAALAERGDAVKVLVLPSEEAVALVQQGHSICRGDVRELDTLIGPMQGVDTVFHLAGMMGVWRPLADYRAVNAVGTENVCRAALRAGVGRLVHVSSWTVYGTGRGKPLTEADDLAPVDDPYSLTKAEGDRIVQRFIERDRLPAVIVRPGTFFGPGDRLHIGRIADRLRAGKGIVIGSGRNALPLVYVTDVVQGLLLAADHERAIGQVYNLSNDRPLTQEGLLRAIAQDVGGKPPLLRVPYHLLYALAALAERGTGLLRPHHQPPVTRFGVRLFGSDNRHAIGKARAELGYEPRVELRDGVRLAAAWYVEQSRPGQPHGVVAGSVATSSMVQRR